MIEGRQQRVLHQVFGLIEVAQHAHQRGGEPARLFAEHLRDGRVGGGPAGFHRYISTMGRISTLLPGGQVAASAIAASRSGTSRMP